MNKNQNQRGKYSAKQALSKKQRKKLEKSGAVIKTRAPREKMPREKKWLISLVATVCVMAIACASFGSILLARVIGDAFTDPTKSVFETIKIRRHLDTSAVDEKFYRNNVFDLSEIQTSYAPLTLADMDTYIKEVLVANRTFNKEIQRQTVIGLGDTVYLYVTDVFEGVPATKEEEKEKRIEVPSGSNLEQLFGTYTSSISFVVGNGTFGEDFDDKLVGMALKPVDTVREVREVGDVSGTDTVCVTYWFQKSKGASSNPAAEDIKNRYSWTSSAESGYTKYQTRVDLSALDDRFASALVDNCPAIGEIFSFVMEDYNLTGGDKAADYEADYLVTAQIVYVLTEEVTEDITFTVPEGYFGEDDGDFYALNGKTATMRVTVLYTDDYDVPNFDRAFITDTLKMEITATDDAGAVAEYKEKMLVTLNEERAESKKLAEMTAAINHLVSKATSAEYYLDSTSDTNEMQTAALAQINRNLLERFLAAYGFPPTTAQLDAYAINLAALQGVTVAGASEYISTVASGESASMIKADLMVYHIFREEGMKITKKDLDVAYAEYMDSLVGNMQDPDTHNTEYFEELYGDDVIKSWVRRDLVYKMVGEYLLTVNSQKLK